MSQNSTRGTAGMAISTFLFVDPLPGTVERRLLAPDAMQRV